MGSYIGTGQNLASQETKLDVKVGSLTSNNYTIAASDTWSHVKVAVGTDSTITVPANATTPIEIGSQLWLTTTGASTACFTRIIGEGRSKINNYK